MIAAVAGALWLGVLTSISPCPLATNLAAVAWLGRRGEAPVRSLMAGLLYTAGRSAAYAVLGGLLTAGLLAAVPAARFLQQDLNRFLGPLLILVGMVLLGLLPLRLPTLDLQGRGERLAERGGGVGAFLLGILFALSFCPVSAALFFGSLLPLAASQDAPWLLPAVYGVGTGLPVLPFALLLALGTGRVGRSFATVERVEGWLRRATGLLFVGVGLYYAWTYVWKPAAGI